MYQSIPKLEMKGWGPSLIHALGYNTTLFAGQSEGSYVLIFVPKKLADFETFNGVLKRGPRLGGFCCNGDWFCYRDP